MADYTGRHRPLGRVFRESKRGPRATCLRFAAVVLMIGAVLASAGFLNRRSVMQTEGPQSPRPSESTSSIVDSGLYSVAAVSPSPTAGPNGAPAAGPAGAPGRTSPPPTGGGVATTKGGPAGAWNFDENKGTVAADSSGFNRSAMLCGGAAWGPGHDSPAGLKSGCAYATGAMLRTDTGFTVSAWVNLDLGAGDSVALSQQGSAVNGFSLMYEASSMRWCMRMPRSDSRTADVVQACAGGTATAGRWTHLVSVYDPTARQVRVYVNGARAGMETHPAMMWRALGYFYVGPWQGAMDDVRAFDYALNDQQVADLFNGKG